MKVYDELQRKPKGDCNADHPSVTTRKTLNIGTWNIGKMFEPGNTLQVAKEMHNYNLVLLGFCETSWKQSGQLRLTTGEMVLYSGHEENSAPHTEGVALLLTKATLSCFLPFGQWTSACTFKRLFVQPSLCLRVCLLCTHLSGHISNVHSVVIVWAGDTLHLFKLPLKSVWKCIKNIPRAEAPLLVIIISNKTALAVLLCFERKGKETNWYSTKTSTQRASNIRGRTGYNV